MAEPRDKATLQERFGFADKDLESPEHDRWMIWLKNNLKSVIDFLLPQVGIAGRIGSSFSSVEIVPGAPVEITFKRSEHPMKNGYFVVGFVDYFASTRMAVSVTYSRGGRPQRETHTCHWYIEVKTEIPSFGKLMRQLRLYEAFIHNADSETQKSVIVVMSTDLRFRDPIEQEGIIFFNPKEMIDGPEDEGEIDGDAELDRLLMECEDDSKG